MLQPLAYVSIGLALVVALLGALGVVAPGGWIAVPWIFVMLFFGADALMYIYNRPLLGPEPARCPSCHYNIERLGPETVCPECGGLLPDLADAPLGQPMQPARFIIAGAIGIGGALLLAIVLVFA